MYKAQCLENQETMIIKIYERAKMKLKHEQRLEREIVLMRHLQGAVLRTSTTFLFPPATAPTVPEEISGARDTLPLPTNGILELVCHNCGPHTCHLVHAKHIGWARKRVRGRGRGRGGMGGGMLSPHGGRR